MRNPRELCREPSGRAATLRGPGRGRLLSIAAGGICALAALGTPRDSAAQFTVSDTPSRSGTLTIPTSPSPASPFSPATPTDRSTRLVPPARLPLPGAPPAAIESPRMEGLPPPLPVTREDEVPRPSTLPPRPAVSPELSAARTQPIPKVDPVLLKAGLSVTLRISQLLPKDGLSPGERLLNGRPPIQLGDSFLAEVVEPRPPYPVLMGGTVREITGPGRFGRPGYVGLQMTQLVQDAEGRTGLAPWRMDLADRRFATRMRRVLLTTLLGLEGAGTGASIGAQFAGGNMAFIGGGMGVGALVGLGYATFQRGTEPNLEPGDTFQVVVGTTDFRPISREWRTVLYPAADPGYGKAKHP